MPSSPCGSPHTRGSRLHYSNCARGRLRCLRLEVKVYVNFRGQGSIRDNVMQVILCTKETSEKVRRLSFKLLVNMGYAAQRCFRKSAEGIFEASNDKRNWTFDFSSYPPPLLSPLLSYTPPLFPPLSPFFSSSLSWLLPTFTC